MAWTWRIQQAAVEQEILFPSKDVYENYLHKLKKAKEPFEVILESENEDGSLTVIMRKRYNNNPFFRKKKED